MTLALAAILSMGAAAILVAILYWLPKIRAFHIEQNDPWLPCETCGKPTDDLSPWSCAIHLIPLCSEPCRMRHKAKVH